MDFLPIAVLILFVLLGGGIAVFADELGRRIGKKRLSLGRRFRPKTTARIITFISGSMITLITMLLIGLTSSEMRTLLLRGRLAIKEAETRNSELRREQQRLTQQNAQLQGNNTQLALQNKDLSTRLSQEQKKLTNSELKLKQYEANLAEAKTKATKASALVASLDSKASSQQRQLLAVNLDLKERAKELKSRKKELQTLQGKYDYVSKEYTDLLNWNQKLQVQRDDLAKQVEDKAKEVADANKAFADLQLQQKTLQSEIEDTNFKLSGVRQALSNAQAQQEALRNMAATGVIHARFYPLLVPKGEELSRVTVPAGTSKDQVFERIESAIVLAKETAKAKGSNQSWQGLEYAGMIDLESEGTKLSVAAQKNGLAIEMAGSGEEQVLIAWAYMNAFADEGVAITFSHYTNPVVYQPGQTLAEIRIDGKQATSKILQGLDSLGARIRARALQDKMIPVQRADMSLGSVSSEEILRLVSEIQRSGGSVRVRARAKRQTRAADPLLLDFDVR